MQTSLEQTVHDPPRRRPARPDSPASTPRLIAFSILAGILATFTLGYHYGLNNHIELLLPIKRLLDPGFCPGDFAVQATAGYEVRFYFSWLCALLARVLTLPGAMLCVALIQNTGVALATAFAARDLHGRENMAPLAAVALVLGVESIQLGDAGFLRQPYGWPAVLSLSLALPALRQGIRLQPYSAAVLAMAATLIHPLVGLETGGLGLVLCGISALGAGELGPAGRWKMAVRALIAAGALVLFSVLVWGPAQTGSFLGTEEFLDLYARFRVPHHVLPSAFRLEKYAAAVVFLLAAVWSWQDWRHRPDTDPRWRRGLPLGTGLVLLLLIAGWLFVEVVPSRLWATLQAFRLVFVLKWFGLLLFAGAIGRAWSSGSPGAGATGLLLFLPVGYAQPPGALWAQVIEGARRRIPTAAMRWAAPLLVGAGYAGLGWMLGRWWSDQAHQELFTMFSLLILLMLFRFVRPAWARNGLSLLFVAGLIGLLLLGREQPASVVGRWLRQSRPILTLADARDPGDGVAWFSRSRLPANAQVLVPPEMGRFRLVAERAIVVDFKCPTTRDASMVEWRRRLADCYGAVTRSGFGAAEEMDGHYRQMTDEQREILVRRYGATHAVLYPDTPTRLKPLYADKFYKLVRLPGS